MSAIFSINMATMTKRPVYDRSDLEAINLPVAQMLQLSRVTEISEKHLVCEMDVAGHWVFPLHFPSDPIFPGSLLMEAAGQAVAVWAWHLGLRGRPRLTKVSAKFQSPVGPDDRVVRIEAKIRRRKFACFGAVELFVLNRKVAEVTPMVIILPDPPEISPAISLVL
jgi:3-hydroxymyristoyl/3-hydroxydecanoyl-(acyl carrier protein) dehydratase